MPSAAAAGAPTPLAVLPIAEEDLFRAERAELRAVLATEIAKRAPELSIVPIAEVDAKVAPLSRTSHARCAFEEAPVTQRTDDEGWAHTYVLDVNFGAERSPELWVRVGGAGVDMTYIAPWSASLGLMDRYKAGFQSLRREDGADALLLGGLGVSMKYLDAGNGVTVCDESGFQCAPETKAWFDQSAAMAKCFDGADEGSLRLLLDGSTSPARCEATNLDDLGGTRAKRETCLCDAARASKAMGASTRRRHLSVSFHSPDLAGKPKPTVRVVDASTNLESQRSWTSADGGARSVYRLAVDGDDRLSAPLGRCVAPAGALAIVDLGIGETGRVESARAAIPAKGDALTTCVEKALSSAAFACTNDGKAAQVRVEIAWPR